jgi:molybdenum-dependent DNA-binding transcriptional regulator ModE
MAAEDSAQGQGAPRRRGRPPGAKSTSTTRIRRKRLGGTELTAQLNHMVAELIKENRKLRRQVVKLTEKGAKTASSTVDRTLRTIQRRVQKALTPPAKRRRRKPAATATTRKKPVARGRKKG